MAVRTKGTRFAALAIAATVALTILPIVDAAPAYATTRPIFGISSGLGSLDSATRDRALTMLEGAGCTWTRVGCYWPWIDRNGKAARDWSVQDAYVAGAKQHHQTIVGLVEGYASWANGGAGDWAPAADPTEFATFARDCVNRYKADVHSWEIWNEENGPDFFKPSPNAAAYAKLLRAAYLAIKSADPSAQVVFGGIDRNDYGYLNRAYAALKAYPDAAANNNFFDVLAVHPYADNRAPESDDPNFVWSNGIDRNFAGLPKMKAAMQAAGDTAKHVMVTEFGWTVTDVSWTGGVGAATQADYLKRAYQMAQNWPWLDCMMWYGFKNWNEEELPFSLVDANLVARASYDAYKAAASGGVSVTGPDTPGTPTSDTTVTPGGATPAGGTPASGQNTQTTSRIRIKTRPRSGRRTTLVGAVSPDQRGHKVKLQRLGRSGWATMRVLVLGSGSQAAVSYRARKGVDHFRIIFMGSDNGAPSASDVLRVVAR